ASIVAFGLAAGGVAVARGRQPRHADAFDVPVVAIERDADDARPGLRWESDDEPGVRRVLFSRVAARAIFAAAQRKELQTLAVQSDVDLVLNVEAANLVADIQGVALQAHLDLVFAVDREVVPDRDTAARAERLVLAHALVLNERHVRNVINRRGG